VKARRSDRREAPLDRVPLEDAWYTEIERYLEFMGHDPLMLRSVSPRFNAARLDLDEHYMTLDRPLSRRPSLLVLPRRDRIIDLAVARRAFEALTGGGGAAVELPAECHYLEFSDCQTQFWDLVATYALHPSGVGRSGG
jgi:hypothetical protein